jgi:hypothetical protein
MLDFLRSLFRAEPSPLDGLSIESDAPITLKASTVKALAEALWVMRISATQNHPDSQERKQVVEGAVFELRRELEELESAQHDEGFQKSIGRGRAPQATSSRSLDERADER